MKLATTARRYRRSLVRTSVVRRAGHLATRCRAVGLGLLFPPQCVGCDADLPDVDDDLLLCQPCRLQLAPVGQRRCHRCAAPMGEGEATPRGCPRCRGQRFHFGRVVAMGSYEGPLRRALLRMKSVRDEALSLAVGQLLARRCDPALSELPADVVVPVPMHWLRRLARGTNSAEILAASLAAHLRLPIAGGVLRRRRNTLQQGGLARRARLENVRDAFRITAGYHLHGVRVLLVDDILTTGATCDEAAKVLRRAGAAEVFVCVAARTSGID